LVFCGQSNKQWITQREKGGVLLPDDMDAKSGMLVIDVLKEKHSDAWVPIHPNWKITK
jgi:hypothetical protein